MPQTAGEAVLDRHHGVEVVIPHVGPAANITVQDSQASRMLYEAWRQGPASPASLTLPERMPVPGSVSLRGRFHFLSDPILPALPLGLFQIGWDIWARQVMLVEAADRALIVNDLQAANRSLDELVSTHEQGLHALPSSMR